MNQVEQLERAKDQQEQKDQEISTQQIGCMDLTGSPIVSCVLEDDDSKGESSCIKDQLKIQIPGSFPKPDKPGAKLLRRYSEQVRNFNSEGKSIVMIIYNNAKCFINNISQVFIVYFSNK